MNPNGLALSPDEKILYVNSSADRKIYRFDVRPDDTIANARLFVDMSAEKQPGVPDGMKVDEKGNLYSTGPGGIWVISPEGNTSERWSFPSSRPISRSATTMGRRSTSRPEAASIEFV